MKKTYSAPAMEIQMTQVEMMMALSLIGDETPAPDNSEGLVNDDALWSEE